MADPRVRTRNYHNDGVSIAVVGAEDVRKKLLDIQMKYRRKIVSRAVRAAAKVLLAAVKALAPVGATGKLARFLRVRVLRPSKGTGKGTIRIGVIHGTREQMGFDPKSSKWKQQKTGKEWFYPAHVEYGTRKRPAQSHLRRALHEQRENLIAVIGRELEAGLEEAAKESPGGR